jgi:hypothetical protein
MIQLWIVVVIIVITSVVLGAAVTIELDIIAHSPQSTIPSGQTLPPAPITSTTPIPIGAPYVTSTSTIDNILHIFDPNSPIFWIMSALIIGIIIVAATAKL